MNHLLLLFFGLISLCIGYVHQSSLFKTTMSTSLSLNSQPAAWVSRGEKVKKLRQLLVDHSDKQKKNSTIIMPCCYDGLTAKLIENAGFDLTFMTGFGVAATYGLPDAGLIGLSDVLHNGQTICSVLQSIPCIGDADTGYGNEINMKRTIKKFTEMGFSGVMIEDQVAPKRCGHVSGKSVVSREDAAMRVAAAVKARDEGEDLVILARTDARGPLGLEEAIQRCIMFKELGADWTFLEAPHSVEEMKEYCRRVPGAKLANMLEYGSTPILSPSELHEIGYTVAAYPLTLLSASVKVMQKVLQKLKDGESVTDAQGSEELLLDFQALKTVVGFDKYNGEMMDLLNSMKK